MANHSGVLNRQIAETPIAIIDLETTGLAPGFDRVVEVSVVKKTPGKQPDLAFDTLVNPKRHVTATEIHGITDDDVAKAPTFNEIAGDLVEALSGCVVAAYNVYFDIKFLAFELGQVGVSQQPPHFCLMYMRPLLDLGCRCNLGEACRCHKIECAEHSHVAANDAQMSAKLLEYYLKIMAERKITTFENLKTLRHYKFFESFTNPPLPEPSYFKLGRSDHLVSRAKHVPSQPPVDAEQAAIHEYWDALRTVLSDLQITDEELQYIAKIRKHTNLPKEKLRVLHARAFESAICQCINDNTLDDNEVSKLRRLSECLSKLGWAPGE